MLALLDVKANDIRDSMQSAFFHIADVGYQAVTVNPFLGNLQDVVDLAHTYGKALRGVELGVFVLTLTSNPEAVTYMKQATLDGIPLFHHVAEQVKTCDADGCVVGITPHIASHDIRAIRSRIGPNTILLMPGLGSQQGEMQKVVQASNGPVLLTVGRDIVYSTNPREKAREYCTSLQNVLTSSDS
jgi:orotidine-5'-phosphate decarboxylase